MKPAQAVFIGRSREPKTMLVILNAWIEVNNWRGSLTATGMNASSFALALGKDPLNDALILPVGMVSEHLLDAGAGATDQPITGVGPTIEQQFKAQGFMGAIQAIAIDVEIVGTVSLSNVDVHIDWTTAPTDWWTWFASWDSLEAFPDGSLVDGQRAYP